MNSCPPPEQLRRMVLGDCADQDALAQHVESCAVCQAEFRRLAEENTGTHDGQTCDSTLASFQQRRVAVLSPESEDGPVEIHPRSVRSYFEAEWPQIPGYEILGELGSGGMGVVYRARQRAPQRIVALKMVLTEKRSSEKLLTRFRAETEAIARLQHPNIVQIYEVGEVEGRPYFAFEYVAGGSLARYLGRQPQPARQAAQLIETLARAVHAAHAQGVIHRDLKPANILLQGAELEGHEHDVGALTPKIADFGLARFADRDAAEPGPTVTGDMLGTPSYMAPEQAKASNQPAGPAADIYALGAILYELLTGRPPFVAETSWETVLQVLHHEPPPITALRPNVPRDLETICLKCLRKEPARRYATALDLAEDVHRFLDDEPIKARPATPVERTWRWLRRHPLAAGLLAAGLLAPIVALVTLSILSARLVRSSALESAAQQAELLEEATKEYSRTVQRVEKANFKVNKTVPPTPGTVPLSIPATFLHDIGMQLQQTSRTGVQVRQYSDYPFPWRSGGGPQDDFEQQALRRLRESQGKETSHEFTRLGGHRVVRYAQARIMQKQCVECHNSHPQSPKKDWQVGDVRGVLEIVRPLENDEARVNEALRFALLLSAAVSGLLVGGSLLVVWVGKRRA